MRLPFLARSLMNLINCNTLKARYTRMVRYTYVYCRGKTSFVEISVIFLQVHDAFGVYIDLLFAQIGFSR